MFAGADSTGAGCARDCDKARRADKAECQGVIRIRVIGD